MKRKRLDGYVAAVFAAVGLAFFGGARPAAAAFPGVNGKIVFQGRDNASGLATIATMDPDGSHQTVLATSPALTATESHSYGNPAWSADGTRIAFEDQVIKTPSPTVTIVENVLFVMYADGTNLRQLTNASTHAIYPSWSPDGMRIAYVTAVSGALSTIEWVSSDGTGGPHLVLSPPTTEIAFVSVYSGPSWSPDGTQIALSAGGFDGNIRILVIRSTGQIVRFVTTETDPALRDLSPDWSPDGTKLVFTREMHGSNGDVWTVNANGTGETNLTGGSDSWLNPVWSPDGTQIAATSSDVSYDIWTMSPAGGGLQQITFSDDRDMPSWQPLVSTVPALPSATGAGPVGFSTSVGVFANLVPVAESTLPTAGKPAVTFPFGLFDWTVTGVPPGQPVTITMAYPGALTPPPQYWKVINGVWTDASSQVTLTASNVLSLRITDGGEGDADGLPNGQISDPGGPAEGGSIDTTPPTITCPADFARSNDSGQAGAVVAYSVTATDDRPGVTVASSPTSGSFFPLGATTVNATAADAAGNMASCSFTVTVDDTEPPVVTAPAGLTVAATSPAGAVVSDAQLGTAHATDNSGLAVVITRTGVPGGNLFPVGTTLVTYTGRDPAGNTASAQQSVVVTAPPTNTACTAAGAGWIASAHPVYFAFAVRYRAGWSTPQGALVFVDASSGQYLRSVAISRLTCSGTHAEIVGAAITGSGGVGFTVEADDRGLQGAGDTLGIHGPGYGGTGSVALGDLVVRIP